MHELAGETVSVGILVYPDVEILDFCGPFEAFSVADRVARRDRGADRNYFRVFLVAESSGPVRARHGLQVLPDHTMHEHPEIDLLLVPGGIVDQPRASERTLNWIKAQAMRAEFVASVCTGAFLLAECGLLEGRNATTHWEDIADLRAQFPSVQVTDETWVDEGRILTSAGIAAGIDMSLHLIARIFGSELADTTARQMVYPRRILAG